MAMEVVPSNFLKYRGTWLEKYILPTIPVGVGVTEMSQITDGQLGKLPGILKDSGKWIGFPNWTSHYQHAKPSFLERWQNWQLQALKVVPVFMHTREVSVFDLDAQSAEVAQWFRSVIERILGVTPVVRRRDGNDSRMVLFFRHKDHTPWISPGHFKVVDAEGVNHAIDLLGIGRGVVIEGPHKSGVMQYWESVGLLEGLDQLPEIDMFQCDEVISTLKAEAEAHGLTVVKGSLHASSNNAAAYKIGDLMSPHLEDNHERLTRAIQHIDLNDDRIEYEEFITILRAICASVGGDHGYFEQTVWPWCCTHSVRKGQGPLAQEQGIEWYLARWNSFTDSQVGADTVYSWAARCNYLDAGAEAAAEKAEGIFGDALPDDNDGSGLLGGGGGGAAGGSGLSAGDTQDEITESLFTQLCETWRYNLDARTWLNYSDGRWAQSDGLQRLVQLYCRQVASTLASSGGNPTPAVAGRIRALRSVGMWRSVMVGLAGFPALQVHETDFDADPHLLNTPAGVVDLRTSALLDHDPAYLMRHMTAVAPDYNLMMKCVIGGETWERYIPDFWMLMRNVACEPGPDPKGDTPGPLRADAIEGNGRWLGYNSSGWMHHQALVFVHGAAGIGKTQIYECGVLVLGSYSQGLPDMFLFKNGEGKRFDIMQLVGIRMAFQDETPMGATWDEMRSNKITTSDTLHGEIKGGRVNVSFRNVTKLTVVGNHKPTFISGETGGLMSRMNLFEAGGLSYRNRPGVEVKNLARRIFRQEGPGVLMYMIDQARKDWEDHEAGGVEWSRLTASFLAATQEYVQENNVMRDWIGDKDMVFDAGLQIELTAAHDSFRAYAHAKNEASASRWTKSTFKQNLKAINASVDFNVRSGRPNPGRFMIAGFGPRAELQVEDFFKAGAKVVSIQAAMDVKEKKSVRD